MWKDDDANRYTHKYVNIVHDKLSLINAASDLIDELMEGLDVDTSNDITVEKLKDFKRVIIKSIDKFNSYIKLETKKKDIEKKDIEKKDIKKKDIKKKDTKNSIKHDAKNNDKADTQLATSVDIKAI